MSDSVVKAWVIEVDLIESLRPGVVSMGEGKPGRCVLCEVFNAFQSH